MKLTEKILEGYQELMELRLVIQAQKVTESR